MTFAIFQNPIAGNHSERAYDRDAYIFFRVGGKDDHAAGLAMLEEGGFGEELAGGRPKQRSVVGVGLIFFVIENSATDVGHAARVGVAFGGDIQAAMLRFLDHLKFVS